MTYANPWVYRDKEFHSTDIKDFEGYVYKITNLVTGKLYIGKKSFWSRRKLKKKDKRKTTVESDWQKYYSSCDPLKADVLLLGEDKFKREILHLCLFKKAMSYYETKEQFLLNIIMTDDYYNNSIMGKYFNNERHLYVLPS